MRGIATSGPARCNSSVCTAVCASNWLLTPSPSLQVLLLIFREHLLSMEKVWGVPNIGGPLTAVARGIAGRPRLIHEVQRHVLRESRWENGGLSYRVSTSLQNREKLRAIELPALDRTSRDGGKGGVTSVRNVRLLPHVSAGVRGLCYRVSARSVRGARLPWLKCDVGVRIVGPMGRGRNQGVGNGGHERSGSTTLATEQLPNFLWGRPHFPSSFLACQNSC